MYQMIQKCSIWKVFTEFARNPTKGYQIREISRSIGLATTSVKLHLKELEKNNLIIKEKAGIYESYKSNFEDEKFRFYKKLVNLIDLKNSGLIQKLENIFTPDAIVLFGSYSKGEDTKDSDIDIFLKSKEKNLDLKKYEMKLKRKIQLFFAEDLNKLPNELQNNILNGIILSGFIRWKN